MATEKRRKLKTADSAFIAMFAALMAVCSWISIPSAIPFTLQTFGVFTAVGVLGGKRGSISVLIYLLLGCLGVPVFAGFAGGIGCLAGSTGGYIIGFLFSALAMWAMERLLGKKQWVLALSMFLGLLICYIFGTVWFMVVYTKGAEAIDVRTALIWCVVPYIAPDMIKLVLAFLLSKRLMRVCRLDGE